MTIKAFTFYLFILFTGSFLYLSIFNTYGVTAPFHVLIIWLMYDRFLIGQKSGPIINRNFIVTVPCIFQNLLFLICLISSDDSNLAEIIGVYFSWIGLILILVTLLEVYFLHKRYSKFVHNRSTT
jgi:hypothetical protein